MAFIKGPFTITWGANTITDVEAVKTDFAVDSTKYKTLDKRTITIDGAIEAGASLTLLSTDIAVLAVLLPQYYVAQGATLSTGEVVSSSVGAIDVAAANCDDDAVYNNLDIAACSNPSEVYRLVNARTQIESVEIDGTIRKITIKFIGNPAQNEASIQFFKEGTLGGIS